MSFHPGIAATIGLLALVGIAACSSDSESAAPAPATSADAGPGTPGDPTAPGITAKDCPVTPTNLNLVKVAPVWGGLVVLESTVPSGALDNLELQLFDPGSQDWRPSYAGYRQKADGRYVSLAQVYVRESTKNMEFKLRVRARLTGCPPSGWAESTPFTLSDPLTGTTWKADMLPGFLQGSIYASHAGAGTTVGPYSATGTTASHTITFNANGAFTETLKFQITSATNGDLYDDCSFQLTYAGTWMLQFVNDSMTLVISERKPSPTGASTGSTCAAPPLADMAINQPGTALLIPAVNTSLSIDYTSLLDVAAGKADWSSSNFANSFGSVLNAIEDAVGADTASMSGSLYSNYVSYLRQ